MELIRITKFYAGIVEVEVVIVPQVGQEAIVPQVEAIVIEKNNEANI